MNEKEMLTDLVTKYGENKRSLIADALAFLETKESKWGLKKPIDKKKYIEEIVARHHQVDG